LSVLLLLEYPKYRINDWPFSKPLQGAAAHLHLKGHAHKTVFLLTHKKGANLTSYNK